MSKNDHFQIFLVAIWCIDVICPYLITCWQFPGLLKVICLYIKCQVKGMMGGVHKNLLLSLSENFICNEGIKRHKDIKKGLVCMCLPYNLDTPLFSRFSITLSLYIHSHSFLWVRTDYSYLGRKCNKHRIAIIIQMFFRIEFYDTPRQVS